MGAFTSINFGIEINPPLPPGVQIGVRSSPHPLRFLGLNLPVGISTASVDVQSPNFDKAKAASTVVFAHLDTGASVTSIDIQLAEMLQLIPTGVSQSFTANGSSTMPAFAIDLMFPNTSLTPFINLSISSCKLNFNLNNKDRYPKNFGLLLGRDILARWNIVWNGPSSTVFIND